MGFACYAVGDNDLILKRNVLTNSVDEQYSTAFNIFPNTTSGNITINISENGKNNNSSFVTVSDVFGKEVFRASYPIHQLMISAFSQKEYILYIFKV